MLGQGLSKYPGKGYCVTFVTGGQVREISFQNGLGIIDWFEGMETGRVSPATLFFSVQLYCFIAKRSLGELPI